MTGPLGSETWTAILAVPVVYLWPGMALRLALGRAPVHLFRLVVDGALLGALPALVVLVVSRQLTGWAPAVVTGLVLTALPVLLRRAPLRLPERREWTAAGASLLALAAWFYGQRTDVARPLERYWWPGEGAAERLPAEAGAPEVGEGWTEATSVDDAGLLRLATAGTAALRTETEVLLAVQGPVGTVFRAGSQVLQVQASPTESTEEGPVRRYRPDGRGVAVAWVSGDVVFRPDAPVTVYAIPSQDALWSLDGSGELRVAHYYQLLNMVEQVDWARERWVTDVQPPLWTPVYAAVLAVTGGDVPTANVLHAWLLVACVLAGVGWLAAYAPGAPAPAWLLPGLGAVAVGKLVVTAGSAGMPDTLYALAIVAAVVALADQPLRPGPFELTGLAAQLLRYPGSGVVAVAALLDGRWRAAVRLGTVVVVAMVATGVAGLATGKLDAWLATVAWETGPEHWHGDTDPTLLLSRIPGFFRNWLVYAGGAPLLAAVAWPRGTRVALGTALLYSLLLCTIDHRPTHYFLPLVLLSVLALGASAAALQPPRGTALASLGVLGLLIFWVRGPILE